MIIPPCFEPNCEFCEYYRFCKNKRIDNDFEKSTGGRPRLSKKVLEEKTLQFLKNHGKSDTRTIIKHLGHSRNIVELILNGLYDRGLLVTNNEIKFSTKGRNGRIWEIGVTKHGDADTKSR